MLTAGAALRRMAALPVVDLGTILRGRNPLVLAPHADDESLGCGGLIAAAVSAGLRPAVLVLTDGTGSHPNSPSHPPERLRDVREGEAAAAAAALGLTADRLAFLRLRDTAAPVAGPEFDDAAGRVAAALDQYACGILLAPWRHDPHCDHLAAHLIAAAVVLRTGVGHLAYPIWGWTLPPEAPLEGPSPDGWRLDIAAQLPAKRRAIAAHRSQHGGLITDDPSGFQLQPGMLARFDLPFETFLTVS